MSTPLVNAPFSVSRRKLLMAGASALTLAPFFSARAQKAVSLNSNTLRVAMPKFDSPPFFSAAGHPDSGLDVELAQGIATALNVKLLLDRSSATFDGAVDMLRTGHADVAICKLSRTLPRGRDILYSRPYAVLHQGLLANRVRLARLAASNTVGSVVRNFRGVLGILAQSSFEDYAHVSFPNAQIREFDNWDALVSAVDNGTIDMAYRDDFEIKKLLIDSPAMVVTARSITLTDKTDTLAIGVRADAPALRDFANLYLDLARGNAVLNSDDLIARYRTSKEA